jgi:hypothetical protein
MRRQNSLSIISCVKKSKVDDIARKKNRIRNDEVQSFENSGWREGRGGEGEK